jgi:hypothetical protein
MDVLLLSARSYSFDAKDGRHVEGVTLTYLTPDSAEEGEQVQGYTPFTVSAPLEVFQSLQGVPGFYQLSMKQKPDSKGKPVLKCVGLKYLRGFNLFQELSS